MSDPGDPHTQKRPSIAGQDPGELLHAAVEGAAASGATQTPLGKWEPPSAEDVSAMLENYEAHTLIGRGGMGAVYKGVQTSLERPVAIKILPPELGANPEFEARFRREAKAMAKLNHPNIVQIHDFGHSAEGHYYIVMEWVDGTDLHQFIRAGQLGAEGALNAVSQICDALEYAHSKGFVHRDIKPANIFLNSEGQLKVGDFGLAKLVESKEGDGSLSDQMNLTMSGVAMGTPNYVAPEQLQKGASVDRRSDIYSLGVMFYEMLTGEVPRGAVKPPSQKAQAKALDVRIDGVVFKAMDPEPEGRYQSAVDLRSDVDVIRTTPPSQAEPGPKAAPAARPAKPKPAPQQKSKAPLWIGIGAGVATLITVLAVNLGGRDDPEGGDGGGGENPATPPGGGGGVVAGDPGENFGGDKPAASPGSAPVVAEGKAAGEEIENALGMKQCWIPAGKFTMGSPEGEAGRMAEREAQVEVELTHGFWMGKYEVTQGEWEAVMGTGLRDQDEKSDRINGEGEDHPMYHVSWDDAEAFCAKLTESEKRNGNLPEGWAYRLPTEAQWEYACRAGEEGLYSGGDLDVVGWYQDNSGGKTHEVGQKKPNAWGLHDVHGNVREWCADWYADELPGGVDPEVTAKASYRVARGGSWNSRFARHCRAAHRVKDPPSSRYFFLGFRLALSPVRR